MSEDNKKPYNNTEAVEQSTSLSKSNLKNKIHQIRSNARNTIRKLVEGGKKDFIIHKPENLSNLPIPEIFISGEVLDKYHININSEKLGKLLQENGIKKEDFGDFQIRIINKPPGYLPIVNRAIAMYFPPGNAIYLFADKIKEIETNPQIREIILSRLDPNRDKVAIEEISSGDVIFAHELGHKVDGLKNRLPLLKGAEVGIAIGVSLIIEEVSRRGSDLSIKELQKILKAKYPQSDRSDLVVLSIISKFIFGLVALDQARKISYRYSPAEKSAWVFA